MSIWITITNESQMNQEDTKSLDPDELEKTAFRESVNSLTRTIALLAFLAVLLMVSLALFFRAMSFWTQRDRATEAMVTAYVVQAVQSFEAPVPLVAGRPGLLRVFVSVPKAEHVRVPAARATFFQGDGSRQAIDVQSGGGMLTSEWQEGGLEASANVEVPGDVLQPGVQMVVEIDPDNVLDAKLGVPDRFPARGRTALTVAEFSSFDVTVVPFLRANDPDSLPNSSILELTQDSTRRHALFEDTRNLLPVDTINVEVHEAVWTSSGDVGDLLEEIEAIRTIENGSGYWMGTMSVAVGWGGAARFSGRAMFAEAVSSTIAHQFGHNLGLENAPCGGVSRPDAEYPEPLGNIGAWGYDRRLKRLVSPLRMDLMSACDPGPRWISGYHFSKAFRRRMDEKAGADSAVQDAAGRALLLWGGVSADGRPFLNPAFVVDSVRSSLPGRMGAWRIVGEAEDGHVLFNRAFEMAEIADGDGRSAFVFALPVRDGWADTLARIVLRGREGTAELRGESHPPMTLWRDRDTGQVRGILQGVDELPQLELDRQESRGIPGPEAWQR